MFIFPLYSKIFMSVPHGPAPCLSGMSPQFCSEMSPLMLVRNVDRRKLLQPDQTDVLSALVDRIARAISTLHYKNSSTLRAGHAHCALCIAEYFCTMHEQTSGCPNDRFSSWMTQWHPVPDRPNIIPRRLRCVSASASGWRSEASINSIECFDLITIQRKISFK